jgi:hypothetical protein
MKPNGLEEGRCYDASGRVMAIVTARGPVGETCEAARQGSAGSGEGLRWRPHEGAQGAGQGWAVRGR